MPVLVQYCRVRNEPRGCAGPEKTHVCSQLHEERFLHWLKPTEARTAIMQVQAYCILGARKTSHDLMTEAFLDCTP
jgi:hypothetical protein